jgi:hypothetical protein
MKDKQKREEEKFQKVEEIQKSFNYAPKSNQSST